VIRNPEETPSLYVHVAATLVNIPSRFPLLGHKAVLDHFPLLGGGAEGFRRSVDGKEAEEILQEESRGLPTEDVSMLMRKSCSI